MTHSERSSVRRILHPTDFSRGSEVAFAHALKLTIANKAALDVIHVEVQPESAHWRDFPQVRKTLIRWGLLPEGAAHSDVASLGLHVHKSRPQAANPVVGILDHLDRHPADLIMLAAHQRSGFDRWLQRPVSGTVASEVEAATLFIPYGVEGFVALEDGTCSLRRILLPVDRNPHPQAAVDAVVAILGCLESDPVEVTLLHVGDEADVPALEIDRNGPSWQWKWANRKGNIVQEILAAAMDADTDLVAMSTEGNRGLLDALLGSTTNQILRKASCAVLAVPAADN